MFVKRIITLFIATMAVFNVVLATEAMAASNTASGEVSGSSSELTDSPAININSSGNQLKLVKRAFLTDGTWLNNPTLPQGTPIHFVIYIENETLVAIPDVNVVDALAGFTYVPNTIKVSNAGSLCTTYGSCTQVEEEGFYAAVNGAALLDDGLNATDVAGYNGSDTISAGTSTSNLKLDIAPSAVWIIMFTVTLN